jgi:hypothetical protein
MSNYDNIYDLVERAAVRRRVPRLELWQKAAKALLEGKLPVINRFEKLYPAAPKSYHVWLPEFAAAINRTSDPNDFRHILKQIIVRASDFPKWLSNAPSGPRGPQHGTTGYHTLDRKHFSRIDKLIRTGKARSAHDAALQLAAKDKIPGRGTLESKARRVSALYRKEHAAEDR